MGRKPMSNVQVTTDRPTTAGARWRNVGADVSDCETVKEVCEKSKCDFEVKLFPIQTVETLPIPGKETHQHVIDPDHRMPVRMDTLESMGAVGADYNAVQMWDSFGIIQPLIDSGKIVFETAGTLYGGRRYFLVTRLAERIQIGPDEIEQCIVIHGSHNGDYAVSANFLPVRCLTGVTLLDRCFNKMGAMHGTPASSVSIKHTKNAQHRIGISQKIMGDGINFFHKYCARLERLAGNPFDDVQFKAFLNALFPDPENKKVIDLTRTRKPVNPENREIIGDIYTGSDHKLITGTEYGAFSSVCEFVDKHRGTRVQKGKDEDEVKLTALWFGQGATIKAKAMNMLMGENLLG